MMTDAGSVLGPEMTAKAQAEFGEARGAKSILSAQSKSNASSEGDGIWLWWEGIGGKVWTLQTESPSFEIDRATSSS
jgi:hypothetical protein